MAENIQHFPVNWIEGMKINKNHFIELQDNIEDLVRDARSLGANKLNYGLLNTHFSKTFQYLVSIDAHNELSVNIKTLKAITPGGGRIEITEYTGEFSEKMDLNNITLREGYHYLLLNVDPYKRVPSGEQNMEEIPPRFPHSIYKYFTTIVSDDSIIQNNIGALQFPIAKIKTTKEGNEILKEYIPPCLTMDSHSVLTSLFETYAKFFSDIELVGIQIIQKIKLRNSQEDENIIANMVHETCTRALRYAEQLITPNKWLGHTSNTMDVFQNIVSFGRLLKNNFDTFSGDGKETLFNYFSEWTNNRSGDYEKLFTDVINIDFKPSDILPSVTRAIDFMERIMKLYVILNQLDYIGRKKDTGIFVNENVLKNEKATSSIFGSDSKTDDAKPNTSSPSFLAD